MRHVLKAAAAVVALATPVLAQQEIAVYFAGIDQQDLFNSSGTRLSDPCTILRQDRANVHRFGRPGQYDSPDPLFGDAQLRGAFGGDCAPFQGYDTTRLRNADAYVRVVVYRMPSGALRIRFGEGAG